jgi:hypothetical protein
MGFMAGGLSEVEQGVVLAANPIFVGVEDVFCCDGVLIHQADAIPTLAEFVEEWSAADSCTDDQRIEDAPIHHCIEAGSPGGGDVVVRGFHDGLSSSYNPGIMGESPQSSIMMVDSVMWLAGIKVN